MKNNHFAELKAARTRGLVARRRAVAKELAWLDGQIAIVDPHLLEQERIFTERRDAHGGDLETDS